MAIQGIIYSNQRVAAAEHAALFQMFISDGVISGCGFSVLRNTLTISSGLFIVAGRLTRIIGSETLDTGSNVSKTMKLIGRCDMTHDNDPNFDQFYFTLVENDYELRKEAINTGSGQYYEIEWATITIDSQGVITSYNVTIGESQGGGGQGGSNFITDSDYTFSGDPNAILYSSSGTDWEIIILEAAAATLNFTKRPGLVDVCLVSAGNNGYAANASGGNARKGGNGGEVLNSIGFTLDSGGYVVNVGTNNVDSNTNTFIKNSGSDTALVEADPANGATNGGNTTGAEDGNGGDGEYAFGDDGVINQTYKTRKYGAGGGRGGVYVKNSSTGIITPSGVSGTNGTGGTTGGGVGAGAVESDTNGHSATDNTGSGGGGGRIFTAGGQTYTNSIGGTGGSGIIIIRNHRAS